MRKFCLLLLVLLGVSWLYAQTANVIMLEPSDQKEAREKWEAFQKAQKDWDNEQEKIKQKYLVVLEGDKDASDWVADSSTLVFSGTSTTWCNVLNESVIPKDCPKVDPKLKIEKHFYRKEWGGGQFEFDKDFRFIVPKRAEPAKPTQFFVNPVGQVQW